MRDAGPTEVGGFGITDADDLLLVHDLVLVKQQCTVATVAFDDEAVADFFEDQVALNRRPDQFGRIWIHTHPGDSAEPSSTDEETFARCFGSCDWAVMFIIAKYGKTHAELHWRQGGPTRIPMRVDVDYSLPFDGSDVESWDTEYAKNVRDAEPILYVNDFDWELDCVLFGLDEDYNEHFMGVYEQEAV